MGLSDAALMGLGFGFALVIVGAWTAYTLLDNRRGWKTVELNAPLVMDAGTRSDEALKIVQNGSQSCHQCGFNNFKHVAFCAVCGDALGDESTRKKALKKREKAASKPSAELSVVRTARAQRRAEWMRKTDVEGKVYWFRAPVGGAEAQQPGYVARFEGVPTPGTASLTSETSDLKVQWLNATSADALAFSTGGVLLGSAPASLSISEKPFPEKYAEFVERASSLVTHASGIQLRFKDADKDDIFHKSMAQFTILNLEDIRGQFAIRYSLGTAFANSTKNVDWHRDWFTILNEKMADPATGIFTCVNQVDQTYYLNPDSMAILGDDHLNYFFAAGRLVGRALLQGDLMAFHMATPLLKILLGQPLSFHDLEHFDPVTYKNLKTLLETKNVESLELDFSVQQKRDGKVVTIDLIPNGRNVLVTDANKLEYLTRKTQFVLVESVAAQLYAFTKGFYEVVPQELLLIFDAEELDYVLCGSDEIDVDEWERESKYTQFLFEHPAKKYFWRTVREMPEDYKRRLLHFATGSTRVPIGGFAALKAWDGRLAPFSLKSVELVDGKLIKSEPCFNKLTLPMYIREKEVKALLYATLNPETYDIVIGKLGS